MIELLHFACLYKYCPRFVLVHSEIPCDIISGKLHCSTLRGRWVTFVITSSPFFHQHQDGNSQPNRHTRCSWWWLSFLAFECLTCWAWQTSAYSRLWVSKLGWHRWCVLIWWLRPMGSGHAEQFLASTPIISGGAQDDGHEMPDLTPITPCSAGLYPGQGHNASGHGVPLVPYSVEHNAERGCDGIAQGLPPVTGVSTSVMQTSSAFAYSRPFPSPIVHSRSQHWVSFAPVSRDTTSGSMNMEATSMYGGIWLPFGIPSREGNYAPVSTHDTANFLCSYPTTPQVEAVPLQSMSRVNLQERFQGPLWLGNAFFYSSNAGIHFHPQSNAGDQSGRYQCHYQPDLRAGSHDEIFKDNHVLEVFFQVMACQASWPIIPMYMFKRCQPGIHMMMLFLLEVEVVSVMVYVMDSRGMSVWGWGPMRTWLGMDKMCTFHFHILVCIILINGFMIWY